MNHALLRLVPAVVLAVSAIAQVQPGPQCRATAAPLTVRTGGYTELVGDIVLACSGLPSSSDTRADFQLTLNQPITSRRISGGTRSVWTDALLLIDEPAPASQVPCVPESTACTNANVFPGAQALQLGGTALAWYGVRVGGSLTMTFRLTNVRVSTAALGASATPLPILASLSISSAISLGVQPATLTVAYAVSGLSAGALDDGGKTAPATGIPTPVCLPYEKKRIGTIRFTEGFSTAFRTRTRAPFGGTEISPAPAAQSEPGVVYATETGFYNPMFPSTALVDLGRAGLADWGTRLTVAFSNVPAGVKLFVDPLNSGSTIRSAARLIVAGAGGTGLFQPAGAISAPVELPVLQGSAMAVWEVLAADPAAINILDFGVYISSAGAAQATTIAYAADFAAGGSAAIPGFAASAAQAPLLNLTACTLSITTASLPDAVLGTAYSQRLQAAGAPADRLAWSHLSPLPDGLSLDPPTGIISGTPRAGGTYTIPFVVTSGNNYGTRTLTLTVISDLRIRTARIPEGISGWTYSSPLAVSGGSGQYAWTASGLPGGLTLTADGVLGGTPTVTGVHRVTLRVTDLQLHNETAATVEMEVLDAPSILWDPAGGVVEPNQQIGLRLSLASVYRLSLSGRVRISFTPDPANKVPAVADVQFDGGSTVNLEFRAGEKQANFAGADAALFRTWTVAGAITFSAALSATNGDARLASPDIANPRQLTIERRAPVLTEVWHTLSGNNLYLCAAGFATAREVTQITAEFRPAAGRQLAAPDPVSRVDTIVEDYFKKNPGRPDIEFVNSYYASTGSLADVDSVTVSIGHQLLGESNRMTIRLAEPSSKRVCAPPP